MTGSFVFWAHCATFSLVDSKINSKHPSPSPRPRWRSTNQERRHPLKLLLRRALHDTGHLIPERYVVNSGPHHVSDCLQEVWLAEQDDVPQLPSRITMSRVNFRQILAKTLSEIDSVSHLFFHGKYWTISHQWTSLAPYQWEPPDIQNDGYDGSKLISGILSNIERAQTLDERVDRNSENPSGRWKLSLVAMPFDL